MPTPHKIIIDSAETIHLAYKKGVVANLRQQTSLTTLSAPFPPLAGTMSRGKSRLIRRGRRDN